jgi:hypothetical protein
MNAANTTNSAAKTIKIATSTKGIRDHSLPRTAAFPSTARPMLWADHGIHLVHHSEQVVHTDVADLGDLPIRPKFRVHAVPVEHPDPAEKVRQKPRFLGELVDGCYVLRRRDAALRIPRVPIDPPSPPAPPSPWAPGPFRKPRAGWEDALEEF